MRTPTLASLVTTLLLVAVPHHSDAGRAEVLRIAVASNFEGPARVLAARFEEKTANKVVLAFGSTGKHAAQIENGAPFAVFLAADRARPERLEKSGAAISGTRFTYATGRLLLWSPTPGLVDPKGAVLAEGDFHHLAIANPRLAPYGKAAKAVLEGRGLWEKLKQRRVRGENITQAYTYVRSGNAELGFVAASQVLRPGKGEPVGSFWKVPEHLHPPIEQQAVLLLDTSSARAFLEFLKSAAALEIIRAWGYGSPKAHE